MTRDLAKLEAEYHDVRDRLLAVYEEILLDTEESLREAMLAEMHDKIMGLKGKLVHLEDQISRLKDDGAEDA